MLDIDVKLMVHFEPTNGPTKMQVTINDENPSTYEKYEPVHYTPAELQQFTGIYYSDELSTTYAIRVEDGQLVATHPRHSNITLTPVKNDVFDSDAWFFGYARFERGAGGNVTGLKVTSGRVMNLAFQKQ